MRKRRALSLAIGAHTLLLTTAYAAEDRHVEEVLVTAERRQASLQSTAVAVSVMSQEALTENNILDVTDLTGFVPNLVVSGQEEQSDIKIYIRGVGTNNPTETGDQGVGVYVDGVYAARAQGALALMYDLENVQVLRGPQGTLFGRNNTGGALLLQTKKPGQELEGDLQLSYGSYNRQQISGAVTLPVAENLSFRIAGYSDSDDGWVTPITTDPRGNQHEYSGESVYRTSNDVGLKLNNTDVRSMRITGLWDMLDTLSWQLSYETFTDEGNSGILQNPVLVESGVYQAFIDSPIALDLQSDVWRSKVSWDLPQDINVEYIAGASDLYRAQVVDQDAGITSRFQEGRTEYQKSTAQSHEIKIQSTGDGNLEWTTGLYYFEEETDIRFDFDGIGAWLDGGQSYIQPARGTESSAVYGQLKYHISDRLSVTGGVRYTDDLKYDRGGRNVTDCENAFIRPTLGGAISVFEDFLNNRTGAEGPDGLDDNTGRERERGQCGATLRNDIESEDDQITYLARASYEWDDSLLYASVGTGYRAGVIQDGGKATDPESSMSYELGYKYENDAIRINTAAFWMEYEDLIRSGFDDESNQVVNSNVAGAQIQGLEAEITWLIGDGGILEVSAAYLDARYTDYITDGSGFGTNVQEVIGGDGKGTGFYNLEGHYLPQSPKYTLNTNYRWDFTIATGVITPRINVQYMDDVYFRDENENGAAINNLVNDEGQVGFYWGNPAGQDAYVKVNAGINFQSDDDWQVDLFLNNATNEMTKSSASVDNNTAQGFPGRYAAPRTWGLRIQTHF